MVIFEDFQDFRWQDGGNAVTKASMTADIRDYEDQVNTGMLAALLWDLQSMLSPV